jgi:septal ring factor EnvC (AmiA/AmiB activator)
MKTVSLFAVLAIAVCLIGCENAELVDCQQDKDILQGQVDQANAAIAEKDAEIESLEAENVKAQNLAMESITTMMTKQAEKDKQDQQKIQDLKEKVAALEAQINTHVCPTPEVVVVEEVEPSEEAQE